MKSESKLQAFFFKWINFNALGILISLSFVHDNAIFFLDFLCFHLIYGRHVKLNLLKCSGDFMWVLEQVA